VECARCGIIFDKWQDRSWVRRPGMTLQGVEAEVVRDGSLGPAEWKILGFGLIAAIVAYALPFVRFVLSALVTLFHELGHAVAGWLLGYPSLPAFDLIYGGGFTHRGEFRISIAVAIGLGMGYLLWLFRGRRRLLILGGLIALGWLFIVTAEWRRELVISSAGHLAEFILAGVLFYKALAGVGWRNPAVERPLGAFIAFFVQIHSMLFAWRLLHDVDFLAWYREGKGGALMNDLESVALDLHIHTPLNPGIDGVTRWLLLFSVLPMAIGLLWFFGRARWYRVVRALMA
jgi:hypothetical protein